MDNRIDVTIKPVGVALNNTIFLCALENKYYNQELMKAFIVSLVKNANPVPGGQFMVNMEGVTVCGKCFKEWGFKEPSNIQKANLKDILGIKK